MTQSPMTSDTEGERLNTKSKIRDSKTRRRSPSPIVFDKSGSPGGRSGSKSPAGYGGVSSTDGELSDSDEEPAIKSTIVPSSAPINKPTVRENSVEAASPSQSGSDSAGSPKAKRKRSVSESRSEEKEEDIPDWRKERSLTPDDPDVVKPRKWQPARSKRSEERERRRQEREDEREREERRRRDDRRRRFHREDERRDERRDDRHRDSYRDRRDPHRRRDDRDDRRRDRNDRSDRDRRSPRKDEDQEKENTQQEKKPEKKDKEATLATKTGGAYIPPARLRMMQQAITDKSSAEYQRMSWEALKKSINGLVNKINVSNIKDIIMELLEENIIRGRGLLCRSVIQAQSASPTFTHVYAALTSVINSKFPQIGELLLKRLILAFRRGYRRNDKAICASATQFLAHLVNQQVAHEVISLEILTLLLEKASDDSVEIAVGFMKECGQKLTELSPRGVNAIFERMRNILHEAQVELRVQYMIEVMMAVRKDKFKDHLAVAEGLELVGEDEQITHLISLEEVTPASAEDMLNIFKVDPEFTANEEKYTEIKREILDKSDDDDSDGSSGSGSDSSSDSDDEEAEAEKQKIIDMTETNLIGLRRTIYLTLQSSLDFEEAAHKLLKLQVKPGQEGELCNMVLDCGAQQRTYEKFYGLLAQRLCALNKVYVENYEQMFASQYETCHRLDPTKLRNVSKFFGHLLHTDAISWGVLQVIKMNEDDTTSSSRIFVKQLFLELAEYKGLPKLNERLKDETLQPYFEGILPRDHPKKTRFAINFFTSIGLGGLTDGLREHLKNMPKPGAAKPQSDSSSSSSSGSSSSSSSDSDSE